MVLWIKEMDPTSHTEPVTFALSLDRTMSDELAQTYLALDPRDGAHARAAPMASQAIG